MTGQLAEQAPFCSLISRRLGAVVLTVDYRLGPLSKCVACPDDFNAASERTDRAGLTRADTLPPFTMPRTSRELASTSSGRATQRCVLP